MNDACTEGLSGRGSSSPTRTVRIWHSFLTRRDVEALEKNNYAQLIQRKWTFQTGWTDSLFSKCLFWFWPFKNVSKCFFFLNNLPNLSKGNAIWNVRKRILGMLEHTNIPTIPKLFAPGHCMGVRALYSSSSSVRHGDRDGMELRGLCPWHGSGATLVLAALAEASPKRTHTRYRSDLPLHAEGMCEWDFDLKPYVLVFLPAAVWQQRQLEILTDLNSPVSFHFASDHIKPS